MKQELMKSFLNDKIKEVIEIIVTITMIFIFNGEEKMLGISVYFQDYDENYLKKQLKLVQNTFLRHFRFQKKIIQIWIKNYRDFLNCAMNWDLK